MKKLFLLCCAVSILTTLNAQRYFGQWSLSAHAGYGVEGYNAGISGEKYLNRTFSAIKADFTFATRTNSFLEWQIPINKYTLNLSYFHSFEREMSDLLFINLGGGISLGAEQFKKINLPYGVIQRGGTEFIAGIFIYPQVEFLFRKGGNISGFIEPHLAFDFLSRVDSFIYNMKFGVKYYL